MSTWTQSVTLTEPAGLGPLASGISDLATAANATLDASQAALDAARLFLAGTAAPEAAAAEALVTDTRGLLDTLFGAGFHQLVVHPWTPGVGRGQGPWRHLDFPACVRAMAESFDDAGDPERPQFSSGAAVELVALVAGAPSPAIFRQVLEALSALTGSSDFRLALRRLEQAFALEAERYVITEGSRPPDWQSATVREAFPALAPLEAALRDNLALLEGYAAGGDKAADIASALISAKCAQLAALQDKLATATALFGQGLDGAGVHALHVSGTGGNALLRNELLGAAGAPGPELSFCAGVCWVGVEGSLAGLAGVLGI
jgi:hypothetical protein